jgi:hypothetical protein
MPSIAATARARMSVSSDSTWPRSANDVIPTLLIARFISSTKLVAALCALSSLPFGTIDRDASKLITTC